MFKNKKKKSREDTYIFNTTVTIFLIALTLISVLVTYLIITCCFIGIDEDDVVFKIERNNVDYAVTEIQNIETDNGMMYIVSFKDVENKAPTFNSKMQALPSGMSLGKTYVADWVCVSATFYKQAVVKNITAMEYTNVEITDDVINDAKDLVMSSLVKNCEGTIRPGGYVTMIAACVIAMILATIGVCIIDKRVKNRTLSYWEQLADEHRNLEKTVVDNDEGNVAYCEENEQLFHSGDEICLTRGNEERLFADCENERVVINEEECNDMFGDVASSSTFVGTPVVPMDDIMSLVRAIEIADIPNVDEVKNTNPFADNSNSTRGIDLKPINPFGVSDTKLAHPFEPVKGLTNPFDDDNIDPFKPRTINL